MYQKGAYPKKRAITRKVCQVSKSSAWLSKLFGYISSSQFPVNCPSPLGSPRSLALALAQETV